MAQQKIPDGVNVRAPNQYFVSPAMAAKLSSKPSEVPKVPLDPEKMELAGHDFPMAWVGRTDIKIGDVTECSTYPDRVYHPGHFNVTLNANSGKIIKLQRELTEFYSEHAGNDRYKFTDAYQTKDLTNLYVAVNYVGNWRRGYIMKSFKEKTSKKLQCKVLFIDYGNHKNFMLKFIRRIPEPFLKELPAQAIKCSLQFDGNAKSLNVLNGVGETLDRLWTIKEAKTFVEDKLMGTGKFLLEFVHFEDEPDLPNPIVWKCRVRGDYSESLEKTLVDEVQMADMFLWELTDKYKDQQHTNDDDDKRYELPRLEPWKFLESCSISHLENSAGINAPTYSKPFIFTDLK